jgi:signal transduction histidine kinase
LLGLAIAAIGLLLVASLSAALATSYVRQPPVLSVAPDAVYLSTLEPDPSGEMIEMAIIPFLPDAVRPEFARVLGSRILAAADFDRYWAGQSVRRLAGYAGGAAAAALMLAVAAGYVLARRVSVPLEALARTASELSADDLRRRVDVPAGADAEIGSLASSLNSMLDRLQESVGQLEALNTYVSHELRNSLTAIRTQLEVGLAGAVELGDAARGALTAAERATSMVEDVLTLAAQSIPEQPQPVDLALIVAEAVDQFAAPGRQLTLDMPVDGLPPACGHETWLYRAVVNLLDNAFKHGPADGPVEVGLRRRYDALLLTVRDRGPGILPEHQELVWQRFWRAERTGRPTRLGGEALQLDGPGLRPGTARGRGYGLGLALVKQAAEAAGGGVWVRSQPGQGTEFCLSVPVAEGWVGCQQPAGRADPPRQARPL